MAYVNLRPSQVVLDSQNPRLPDGTSSDRDAVNRLLEDGAEALVNLARDLARTGQTNPAELPIAVKTGSKYLVLEGNRRFAALKLLQDPALADNEDHQKAFRRAAALGTPPKTVYTLVAVDRNEADHWIVLRHTGENNGTGVKRWSASQTATHRRRADKSIDSGTARSVTIADELDEIYAGDVALTDLVKRTRREKLTNIGRFFSPEVLTTLHLSISSDSDSNVRGKTLWARHTSAQLRDLFYWAFDYILNNSVDAYKNAAIRAEALRKVGPLIPGLEEAWPQPFRLSEGPLGAAPVDGPFGAHGEDGDTDANPERDAQPDAERGAGASAAESGRTATATATQHQTSSPTAPQQRKSEAKPDRYLTQRLKLPNHPERIQRLLKECRGVDLEQTPGIACVMMRVLVELSLSSDAALRISAARESDTLKNKIMAMLRFLDPDIENPRKRDKTLEQAFLEASELGIQYMNGFVHGSVIYPDHHLARRFSNAFAPLLERVDRAI